MLFSLFIGALVAPVAIRLVEDRLERRNNRSTFRRGELIQTYSAIIEVLREHKIDSLMFVGERRNLLAEGAPMLATPANADLQHLGRLGNNLRALSVKVLDPELRSLLQEYLELTNRIVNREVNNDGADVLKWRRQVDEREKSFGKALDRVGELYRELLQG